MLKSKFVNADGSNASKCGRVAITGLGGMGKTQVAIEFCYRNSHGYLYVFWVHSDTETMIHSSFRNIANLLNLPISNTDEPMTIVKKVTQYLRGSGRWLLVFDNADDHSILISKYFPTSDNGDIIITTRDTVAYLRASTINLDEMTMNADSSLKLLMRSSISPTSEVYPAALDLVKELGYLPLAVDLAGAYMEQTFQTPSAYLSNLKNQQRQYLDLEKFSKATGSQYGHSVLTVWKISFERLKIQHPLTDVLLRGLSFVYPDNIPVKLFKIALASEFSQQGIQSDNLIELVVILRSYSFVRQNFKIDCDESDPAKHTLSIHRLVQTFVLLGLDKDEKSLWCQKIISALDQQIYDKLDVYASLSQRIMSAYTPHIHHTFTNFTPTPSKEITSLLIKTLSYSHGHATYDGTETLGKIAISNSEIVNGPTHPYTATSLNGLAVIYQGQGKHDDAEPLYKRALVISEKAQGPRHPDTATSLNNLASLYGNQGKYDDAEPLLKRALEVKEEVLGPTHPSAALLMGNLANLYRKQGKYDNAESLFKRSLEVLEKTLGPLHPATATAVNNMAALYEHRGMYDDAKPLFKRALEVKEKTLGPMHLDIATPLNNLASIYESQGKYDDAEPLFKRALAIFKEALGPTHPLTSAAVGNIAGLYCKQKKYDDAESLLKQVLAVQEETLGATHPNMASWMNNLAVLYSSQGKYDDAEPLYIWALAVQEETLGATHPDTVSLMNDLAAFYYKQRMYDDAEPLLKQVLAVREEVLGFGHLDTAKMAKTLGEFYFIQGKYDDAERLCERALKILIDILGHTHPTTATVIETLVCIYGLQKKYDDDEHLNVRMLRVFENVLGVGHPITVIMSHNAGRTLDRSSRAGI